MNGMVIMFFMGFVAGITAAILGGEELGLVMCSLVVDEKGREGERGDGGNG